VLGQAGGVTTRADPDRLTEVLWPAVLAGAFFGPTMQVFDVLVFDEAWSWGEVAGRSAFFAVAMALVNGGLLRVSAAARERAAVQRAVSTGVLPEGVDEQWTGRLAAERHRLRSDRVGVPVVLTAVAALTVVASLQPDGPGYRGWVLAAVLQGAAVVLALWQHRRLRTAERLSAELEERLAQV
jgi:hypothetical protein